MIKIENVVLPSTEQWKSIIMGMRNPLNSWHKSDSDFTFDILEMGENDYNLMKRLRNAGVDHRKFMRMITVYMDIECPLYWWKEFDTYKISTVTNSCSTMHKIHAKEFTLDDFSHEHLSDFNRNVVLDGVIIKQLNKERECYIETKDKEYWWQMIQLLPSSYNQKRTILLNYEVLANMYKSRKNHKLDEWRNFCDWIKTLPYSELIIGEE
jgi:hypothetical protein